MKSLLNKPFLSMTDYTPEEFAYYLDLAAALKKDKKEGKEIQTLKGKNFALIFEKDSTRTRCAFEYRGFKQSAVEELAAKAGVPVWNGLTDYDHPTQTLANFLTLKEHFNKPLNELSFAYVGHGQSNMAHALMAGAALAGMDFRIIGPAQFFPEDDFLAKCQKIAEKTGATFTFTDDPVEGVKGLDVIYTGVWVTMGDPYELWGERIKLFMPYRITMDMIKNTGNPDTVFCHCLPAFHNTETKVGKDIYERFGLDGIEVTDDVFEAPFSLAFQEAANRLPTIKAVMVASFAEYPIHE